VRPLRYDEVIESVAGVVGGDDNTPITPFIVLGSFVFTVFAHLGNTQIRIPV